MEWQQESKIILAHVEDNLEQEDADHTKDEEEDNSFLNDSKCPPDEVRRKLRALRKLQHEQDLIEVQFHQDCHALRMKYSERLQPIYTRRYEFICGTLEPTKSESAWPSNLDDDVEQSSIDIPTADLKKGIPNFWLVIFMKDEVLKPRIQEHDKAILKHLMDIKVQLSPKGFQLQFVFEPNDYFNNTILTKEYGLCFGQSSKVGDVFDGPFIDSCRGCSIDWKECKDITSDNKAKSFFDYFTTTAPDVTNPVGDSSPAWDFEMDFEIGRYIRDVIVPQAICLYDSPDGGEDFFEDAEDYIEDEDLDYDPTADRQPMIETA